MGNLPVLVSETWTLGTHEGAIRIVGVHPFGGCKGRCVLHAPTQHAMSHLPLHYRVDRGIFERICPHGVGHPDPDQYDHWEASGDTGQAVHGCCGESCCAETAPAS